MVSRGKKIEESKLKGTNGRKLAENFFDQDKILNQLTESILYTV
jgi:hypothetical protein